MTLNEVMQLHDFLVSKRIVRINTKDGSTYWVEYADKYTGRWRRIT